MPLSPTGKIICWWSAGITSAVACKLAIDCFGKDQVSLIYFQIDSAHPDNTRFKLDCEEWYGKEIEVWRSDKYTDQYDVIEKTKYINGPDGARCTLELKKNVRYKVEREVEYSGQVFGFEFCKKEVNRALRFLEQYPVSSPIFPLIEAGLTKKNCLHYIKEAGIVEPVMYTLGYPNNNCIGCVKGGMGYWNKIRTDFPDHFTRMSNLETEVGNTCIRSGGENIPLKDLDPTRGHGQKVIMPDCGNFCEIEFQDLPHPSLDFVLSGGSHMKDFYNLEVIQQ